jgi:uncharacterized protein (TIGR02391 family)
MNHQEIHNKLHEALQKRKDATGLWGDDWLSIYAGLILQEHHPVDRNSVNEISDFVARTEINDRYLGQGRNLLAGFLAVPFLEKLGRDTEANTIASRTEESFRKFDELEQTKFSILNSPQFLYGSAFAICKSSKFSSEIVSILKEIIAKKVENLSLPSISRSCLILAAAMLLQLDRRVQVDKFISSIDTTKLRIDENVLLLWFLAKFGEVISSGLPKPSRKAYLTTYSSVESALDAQLPAVSFDLIAPSDDSAITTQIYCLSPMELILLDEIVLARSLTKGVNVQYLFDQLPLHAKVRKQTVKLFQEGNYSQTVEESFKLLIDEVKNRAGHPKDNRGDEFDGVPLMRHVFGLNKPILVFNKLKTKAERDEQEGMTNLFVGATQGIRNPATHVPSQRMNPFDALEAIELASFLMNRLEKARRAKP